MLSATVDTLLFDTVASGYGLAEEDLFAAFLCAKRFLASHGAKRLRFSCDYLPDDVGGPGEFAVIFDVGLDPDASHLLERALFEHLAAVEMPAEMAGAVTFGVG